LVRTTKETTMSATLKTMLVAVDFSPSSRNAVGHALRLAGAAGANLHAVHVVDTVAVVPLAGEMSAFQMQITDSLLREARDMWHTWTDHHGDLGGAKNVPLSIEIGSPVAAITHEAKKVGAGLLVMGNHGGSAGEKGVGVIAGSCVRRSPCDVLLVHQTQTVPFKNILVAIDFSPTAKEAVEQALRLAALEGATLHVVYAFTPPWERMKPKAGSPESTDAFRTSYQQTLEKQIENFVGASRPEVVWAKPSFHAIPHKSHGKAIAEFARVLNVDLIVLGTRGASNLHDILLGSTAEQVLRDAHRSILAIRPKN
jgi:nucleotide-binding universal stress UspA family protein